MKILSLPQELEVWMDSQLKDISSSLSQAHALAHVIKQMADFYIENPQAPTPWSESWCQKAQLAYYFPLNFLRNLRVFQELQSLHFFQAPFHWYEIGTGLGPSLEAFLQTQQSDATSNSSTSKATMPQQSTQPSSNSLDSFSSQNDKLLSVHLLETATPAKNLYQQRLQNSSGIKPQWLTQIPKSLPPQSLLVMSYSFTELEKIPEWIWSADSIIIIEPSTREDGRRLLQLRAQALQKGFHVVAPCTHNQACPLLTHSQKDWCHDRFGFDRPAWMLEIEKHLPFRNQTLTLSYLALKRQAPLTKPKQMTSKTSSIATSTISPLVDSQISSIDNPQDLVPTKTNLTRVIGDFLDEKGKTRQLICRGPEREFLAFVKKSSTPVELFRGDLLTLPDSIEKKGDELRPSLQDLPLKL